MAAAQIVTYRVDDQTTVDIEINPIEDFAPAGVGDVVSWVREAAAPALKAAQVVLEQAQQLAPDTVEVSFGLKASGRTHWLIARADAEGTFKVSLTWRPGSAG